MRCTLSCATLCVPVNEIVKDFTFADPVRTYVIVLSQFRHISVAYIFVWVDDVE